MPVLPLILAFVLAPLLGGCSRLKELVLPEEKALPETDCSNQPRPDEYKNMSEDSYAAFRLLWGTRLEEGIRPNWLAGFMDRNEPVATEARENLGASRVILAQLCMNDWAMENDKERLSDYHGKLTGFFRDYFEKRFDPNDSGILVMIGGLAPSSAGQSVVFGALDALNIPFEKASPERTQKTEFTQVLKAGLYYNFAADRLGAKDRFRTSRTPAGVKAEDKRFVRQTLGLMDGVLADVDTKALSDKQKGIYDVLKASGASLKASLR